MEIGKAFTYVFDDKNWLTKVLLGGLFTLLGFIPIIGISFLLGYVVETIKNVMDGVPGPLPEWDNLGEKFKKGLMLALILFIYQIPAFLFQGVRLGVAFLTLIWAEADPEMFGNAETMVRLIECCLGCLTLVWQLLILAITPAIFIKYTLTEDFTAAFRFGELFDLIKADLGNYVVVTLLTWVAGIVALIGLVGLCIGVYFTTFWSQMVQAHLCGQLYRSISTKSTA